MGVQPIVVQSRERVGGRWRKSSARSPGKRGIGRCAMVHISFVGVSVLCLHTPNPLFLTLVHVTNQMRAALAGVELSTPVRIKSPATSTTTVASAGRSRDVSMFGTREMQDGALFRQHSEQTQRNPLSSKVSAGGVDSSGDMSSAGSVCRCIHFSPARLLLELARAAYGE